LTLCNWGPERPRVQWRRLFSLLGRGLTRRLQVPPAEVLGDGQRIDPKRTSCPRRFDALTTACGRLTNLNFVIGQGSPRGATLAIAEGRKAMRPSLLLALAFFSALIDHAQAANDHHFGCVRFFYGQDLPNCKEEAGTGVRGTEQVAQATSRTGGYDRFPGGGSAGGIPSRGVIYHSIHEHSGATNRGGSDQGGSRGAPPPGGSNPGGSNPGGSNPASR
jgi:hypothetical protein